MNKLDGQDRSSVGLRSRSVKDVLSGLLPLAFAIALTVVVTRYRKELQSLSGYGYAGIFVACIAANSTVLLPAPSSAIVLTFAYIYSPFWVAIVGGLGAAAGELVGYVAGLSGRRMMDASQRGQRLQAWMAKYGVLTIFVLAFLPLPLFDLVGVMAGALRMHLLHFLIPTATGKLFKMLIYAYHYL